MRALCGAGLVISIAAMSSDAHVARQCSEQGGPHMSHIQAHLPVIDGVPLHAEEEDMFVGADDEDELAWLRSLPWWRRPRPLWLLPIIFTFALSAGMMLAARIELLLTLICDAWFLDDDPSLPPIPPHDQLGGRAVHIPSSRCRQSVQAQSKLSIIQLELLVLAGVCSMLTTGFWSQLSDRTGRKTILAISLGGAIINDAIALLVSFVPLPNIPMGWWILFVGSAVEGGLGASGTVTAMAQSYLTDVTLSGTRSRVFALMTGIMFFGIAVGPTIGGFVTRYTGSLSTTILLAAVLRLFIWAIVPFIPDSLSPVIRARFAAEHQATECEARAHQSHLAYIARSILHALMSPFRSLLFLLPKSESGYVCVRDNDDADDAEPTQADAQRGGPNLLFLSAAYAIEAACIAVLPIKIQYVQLVFGWSSSTVGLYVSFAAFSRMLALTVFVPVLVRVLHRRPKSIVLPQDMANLSSEMDLDAEGYLVRGSCPASEALSEQEVEKMWQSRAKSLQLIFDSHMDMYIAMGSAFITILGSVVMAHVQSVEWFLIGTFAVSLGAGIGSALSSLGMAVVPHADGAGRLFGAWAVLSTASGAILGPALFSIVFSRSASTAPSLSFYLVGALQLIAVFCLFFVRLSSKDALEALPPRPRQRGSRGRPT